MAWNRPHATPDSNAREKATQPKDDMPTSTQAICALCSKLGLENFKDLAAPRHEKMKQDTNSLVISLSAVLDNHDGKQCSFCTLLFDSMCANGLFNKPFDRMIDKSQRNLSARDRRNSAQLELNAEYDKNIAALVDYNTFSDLPDARQVLLEVSREIASQAEDKLPVAVSIQSRGPADDSGTGLFNVRVWSLGWEPSPNPVLSCQGSFDLRLVATSSDQSANISHCCGKVIQKRVDLERDCRTWLDDCLSNHDPSSTLPSWVYPAPVAVGDHFRLIDVKNNLLKQFDSLPKKYATLSYILGKVDESTLQLHTTNLETLSQSMEDTSPAIAKTIRDTIEVTKGLGIPYLWVDSLCIIQKDSSGFDNELARKSQIRQMDIILGHATIALVAADTFDINAGLPGISTDRSTKQIVREIMPGLTFGLQLPSPQSYGMWDTRAWTLQEKLLAQRLLIFTEDHVSFHCRHGVKREDVPFDQPLNESTLLTLSVPRDGYQSIKTSTRLPMSGEKPVILRAPQFTEYANIVKQYTVRDIADSADVLNGIMGLFNVLEAKGQRSNGATMPSRAESNYLHGLPERFLDLALLWQPPASDEVHLTRRAGGTFPSWSWAGWGVSKVALGDAGTRKYSGIRYEEPFHVSSNGDSLSLKKIIADDTQAEERYQPKVLWYKVQPRQHPIDSGLPPSLIETPQSQRIPETAPQQKRHAPPVRRPQASPLRGWSRVPKPVHKSSGKSHLAGKTDKGTNSGGNPTRIQVIEISASPIACVNGEGLGVVFENASESDAFMSDIKFQGVGSAAQTSSGRRLPKTPHTLTLSDRCLICETETASFTLKFSNTIRKEVLWRRKKPSSIRGFNQTQSDSSTEAQSPKLEIDKELRIWEAEILDDKDEVVGHVIPTDRRQQFPRVKFDFMVLSKSQYWGNERRVDVGEFPLYNVMMIEWDQRKETATRLGVGKVQISAWMVAKPEKKIVILV
ncbi:hypothetical protein CSPX01_08709 [Colletotrichum filicis]|nr:hypothetical protein CSPX01_08709 [Colletotrichum filicis]